MLPLFKVFLRQLTAYALSNAIKYGRTAFDRSGEYKHFQRARLTLNRTHLAMMGGVLGTGTLFWASRMESIPYTNRRHVLLISIDAERQMGTSVFQEVKRQAEMQRAILPESHHFVKLVRSLGIRIAQVASEAYDGSVCEHMKNLDWEFIVIESNDVNAFVVPGGKVVVFSGLINEMKHVDELAAVLAHEVAHVVARHAAERMTQAGFMVMARILFFMLIGFDLPMGLPQVLFSLPNSRRAETEADVIGIRLMAKACFDPLASQSMLNTLDRAERKAVGNTQIPPFLRTHPVTSERVAKIKEELSDAMIIYADNACHDKRDHLLRAIARATR